MKNAICVAGKGRIAIDTLRAVQSLAPNADHYVVFNSTDDGVDGWQPSFRRYIETTHAARIMTLAEVESVPDLLFLSVEFDKLVRPSRFRDEATLVNIHFSRLPAYKGMYTSCLPILCDETRTGCTLHLIDTGIDTGDIIDQVDIPIAQTETAKTLYRKYRQAGADLIARNLLTMISGRIDASPQPVDGSTYFSKSSIDYGNLTIDLRQTANMIRRQIAAFHHRSYQLPSVFGFKMAKALPLNRRSVARAGTILAETDHNVTIATIDYDCMLVKDEFEVLIEAIRRQDEQAVEAIVQRNTELLSESTNEGWTPLIVASYLGQTTMVELLLSLGADPNFPNEKGTTPLMYAKDAYIRAGDDSTFSRLLNASADAMQTDMTGWTVFDYTPEPYRSHLQSLAENDRA